MNGYPYVEMTPENKGKLADSIAISIASDGGFQEEIALNGFTGINEMTQEEFNQVWWSYYGE